MSSFKLDMMLLKTMVDYALPPKPLPTNCLVILFRRSIQTKYGANFLLFFLFPSCPAAAASYYVLHDLHHATL